MISSFSLLKKRKDNGGESSDGNVVKEYEKDMAKPGEATETADTVRALGTYHEGLRNRSETALSSLKALRNVAEDVDGIFGEFAEIARQLHLRKKELSEIKSSHEVSVKLNEELRAKLSGAQATILKLESQLDELVSERDNLARVREELSETSKTNQIGLKEAESRIKVLDGELNAARVSIENLTAKAEHLTDVVADNERQLNELREERKMLQSSVEFETAERARFSKLHDEVVESMQSQRRALTSASEELEKARERIMNLESKNSELLGAREELQASIRTAETLRETDAKNFEVKMEALASRARLAEHLLEKARDEQRSNFRDYTASTELQRRIRDLETQVSNQKEKLGEAARRNKELESSEAQLQAKLEDASLQLRTHNRTGEQSSEKIRMQQEVIEALHKRHSEYIAQVEEQTRKLNDQLENERSDRVYLEGALNSARRERNFLQTQLIKLKGEDAAEFEMEFNDEEPEIEAPLEGVVEELRPRKRSKDTDATDK